MKKLILAIFLTMSFLYAEIETFTRDYTYNAGDEDSKNSSRAAALVQVKKLLLEEVGTYIESRSVVENNMLTKDKIIAICAGITKTEILSEDWSGKTYTMQAKIQIDQDDVLKNLNRIAQDSSKTNELKEQYDKVQKALADNERLSIELAATKDELQREKLSKLYEANTNTLSLSEWFDKGNDASYKGDYELALECYKKAIDINPKVAEVWYNAGQVFINKKDYDSAIKCYKKAIEIYPSYTRAHFKLGFANDMKGDYGKAIESYLDALFK